MRQLKAVFFDLDGTLLDTLRDLYEADRRTMREFGYPEPTEDEVRSYVGNGIRKLLERSLPDGALTLRFEEMFRYLASYYRAHSADHAVPYKGIPGLMKRLKEDGYRIAVISNKPDGDTKRLCELFFPGIADCVYGARENIALKPDAAPVREVLKEMNLAKEEAVYAGDSEVDLQTAENAGMRCISVTWGFRSREALTQAGAAVLVNTPEEFYTWIKEEEDQ